MNNITDTEIDLLKSALIGARLLLKPDPSYTRLSKLNNHKLEKENVISIKKDTTSTTYELGLTIGYGSRIYKIFITVGEFIVTVKYSDGQCFELAKAYDKHLLNPVFEINNELYLNEINLFKSHLNDDFHADVSPILGYNFSYKDAEFLFFFDGGTSFTIDEVQSPVYNCCFGVIGINVSDDYHKYVIVTFDENQILSSSFFDIELEKDIVRRAKFNDASDNFRKYKNEEQ